MAKAAQDILAILGSKVDCERLFSRGKDILGIRRLSLSGETMQWLAVLKSYFKRKSNRGKAKLPIVRLFSVFHEISTNHTSFTAPSEPPKAQLKSL
jgi:hypothetical protein